MLSIFSYVSGPSVCPLWRSFCSSLLPFFSWVACLLTVESCEFFIYFGNQTLAWGIIGKCVFPYCWSLFILMLFSLAMQKLFILMRSQRWAKDLNRHLTKEDMQMASKHMKSCSVWFFIKELRIKTIMRWYYTSSRMIKAKPLTIPNASNDVEQQTLSQKWKMVQQLWTVWSFLQY